MHVDESRLRQWFLDRAGVRLGPQTCAYVLRRLPDGGPIPVMGGDARTGVPVRRLLNPTDLAELVPNAG